MAHILRLPDEIMVMIFAHILKTESQDYFLSHISTVCKEWEAICYNPQFWHKYDGSLPSSILYKYSTKGVLHNTEILIYSSTAVLRHSKKLEKIFAGLPNLRAINFSNVRYLDAKVFACLHKYCKKLREIKMSTDLALHKYCISLEYFGEFLEIQGHHISVLDLSSSNISNPSRILVAITQLCCNLEELVMNNINCSPFAFPLKEFQERCTKMKVLRLSCPAIFPTYAVTDEKLPGFPLLEIFTFPHLIIDNGYFYSSNDNSKFTDPKLINILSNSPFLKVLDLRGCRSISTDVIMSLPAKQIEALYISMTSLVNSPTSLKEILKRWIQSLSIVDISCVYSEYINEVVDEIISEWKMCSLKYLDLSRTCVRPETVIRLIRSCKNLQTLKLSLSWHVDFGVGPVHEYYDRSELLQFVETLFHHIQNKPSKRLKQH